MVHRRAAGVQVTKYNVAGVKLSSRGLITPRWFITASDFGHVPAGGSKEAKGRDGIGSESAQKRACRHLDSREATTVSATCFD